MRGNWFDDDGIRALVLRRYSDDAATKHDYGSRLQVEWLSDTLIGWGTVAAVVATAVTIPVLWGGGIATALLVRCGVPGVLWAITALLLALGFGYRRRLHVGQGILAEVQSVVSTIPEPLVSILRRGVQNTRTVTEECYKRTGRENSALAIEANATLSAMCDTALNLSQMLAIDKRNSDIKGNTGPSHIVTTMQDARRALMARIEAARERMSNLEAALAMLAQASFIIGDDAEDDAIIDEVIASTKALLEVGNQAAQAETQPVPVATAERPSIAGQVALNGR